MKGPVKPGDEVTITLELQAPLLPGNNIAFFRFVHGDNNRFGQKVWCDIMVLSVEPEFIKKEKSPVTAAEHVAPPKEQSSLLNEEYVFEAPPVNVRDIFERISSEAGKPSLELSQAHYEEKPAAVEERSSLADPEPEFNAVDLKDSQVSQEELERIAYLDKLQIVKDSKLHNALKDMFDIGYYNFELNQELLKRHKGNTIMALDALCNGFVTESMFQAK